MNDVNWITEILLDIARFAEENKLPKTCEALIDAVKIATIEARHDDAPVQYVESNVISLFERQTVGFAVT